MKTLLKDEYYRKLLVLGVLLRLLIMPFFFHPDIKTYHFQSSYFKKGVFNIYDYLDKNKQTLPLKEEFVYFPLSYITLGGYQYLANPFLGKGFDNWLSNAGGFGERLNIFRYLFILKLPYLVIDIAIAFILIQYFKSEKRKKQIYFLWLFNPFSILLIYLYSNIDIIPVLMSVIALLFVKRNKGFWAGVALAIGAGFKGYPMLLLPSLLLTSEKFSKKITNIMVSLLIFVLILVPFWSQSFIKSAFSSGLTNRIFEYGIDIGLPRKIPYYLLIYSLGFIYIYLKKRTSKWNFFLLVTLMLVAMIDYHVQWLIWFIPFVLIAVVKNTKNILLVFILMTLAVSIPLLLNDRFMTSSLFSPISDFFYQVSYPYMFIKQFIDPLRIQSFIHYLFMATSLVFVIKIVFYEKS